jgi:hypothetical protein
MGLMRRYALRDSKAEALAQYEQLEEAHSRELSTTSTEVLDVACERSWLVQSPGGYFGCQESQALGE